MEKLYFLSYQNCSACSKLPIFWQRSILHLAAAVMHADGITSPEEERHLEQQLENWLHLDQAEMIRLRAHSYWLLSTPQSFSWLTEAYGVVRKSSNRRPGWKISRESCSN